MNPVYDGGVPGRGDSYAESQIDFLNNFRAMFDIFQANHVAMATPTEASADQGKHTIVELVRQTEALQTLQGEYAVYDKKVEGQTDQLFMRQQNNGPEIQWTNYQIYSVATNQFFSFLPGGYIIYFGILTPTTKNPTQFLLNPAPRNVVSAHFVGIGTTANSTPFIQVSSREVDSGKKDVINLYFFPNVTVGGNPANPSSHYYIVIANF